MSKAMRVRKFPTEIFNIKNADTKVVIMNDKEVKIEFRLSGIFAGACTIRSQMFGNVLIEFQHEDLDEKQGKAGV